MTCEADDQIARVAALGEPIRRELYRYVAGQDQPVGREEAAAGVGVAHHVAKFHLDKLVADGLLDTEYARPPGRGGPGAGRPAKLYRRSSADITVSLPSRHYDLAGRVMAEAITTSARDAIPLADALRAAARAAGHALGDQSGVDTADRVQAVSDVLASNGYEPRAAGDGLVLANCPFHSLAENYTELVCGINVDLIGGLLDALGPVGSGGLRARLQPEPGRCCVTVRPSD